MASKTVTVLTTHGRRQNVKVEPNTTILDVLEQVCSKFNFNAAEYDLKHHNKIMDLSAMFRFSGLPNNALLEMVPATKVRTEEDIMLVLQLEDGTRLEGTFKPSAHLLSVLEALCKEKANAESNPVMIYMRREVLWDSLAKTTLKSLGLTGGRAIIRLLQRKPEELKTQANVSAPLPQKEKPMEVDVVSPRKTAPKETVPRASSPSSSEPGEHRNPQDLAKKSKAEDLSSKAGPSKVAAKSKPTQSNKAESPEKDTASKPNPIVDIIGERDAVLFHLETAQHCAFDLPDSFFDVTVKDVQKMYTVLKNKVKELDEQPLMTSELRKLEDEKRVLNSLARYKNTVIRVQFPDRYILQGIFKLHDTVADVIAFVHAHLADQSAAIHLYTTPPKVTLSPESTLVEAKCVPQAILHVGFEADPIPEKPLQSNLYGRLSNATGATELAARTRKHVGAGLATGSSTTSMETADAEANASELMDDDASGGTSGAGSGASRLPNANFRPSSVQSATASDVKMPKWFKPLGK